MRSPRIPITLLLAAGLASAALTGCATSSSPRPADSPPSTSASATEVVDQQLASLEAEFDARVGVAAVDTGDGRSIEFRSDERFGYASTLKAFAAAEFLATVTAADRVERVYWTQADVDRAGYSPVTSSHLTDGLTLEQLAEAAVRESDNTALNVILEQVGGPAGLDAALGRLGDTTTDVVNYEPELNDVVAGEAADTTSPKAFSANLAALLDGPTLTAEDRDILLGWMSGNASGDDLIRAGAPAEWTVADKSGGAGAIRNDIAIVTPPGRAPIVITILTTRNDPVAEYDDTLVSRTAEAVLEQLR